MVSEEIAAVVAVLVASSLLSSSAVHAPLGALLASLFAPSGSIFSMSPPLLRMLE